MTAKWKTYYFEDLSLGMRETIAKTVTHDDIVSFAHLSGDHNPLHLDDDFAAQTQFGKRIAHGLFTASLISAVIGTHMPGPGAIYLQQSLTFKGPVHIGDEVIVSVEVAELIERGARCKLYCLATVAGKPVLEGDALVKVPARKTAAPKETAQA
ncbi:3-hydroxybutyryl-CoA dehydratase [Rhodoblastus acidophilus]|uniref:3-hydroxybutyryl-CoA dehydratase n=1 Tax=Rhodoblastus acidophilus TaxID=1074 RepID=A0A212R1J8_RHOAC|nr:MaoC family dehydratase [Rhodoblastus acidophilus]MCW2314616.1 3-hydroxybutyryl-CoA dehydratase [Rhodoblastus acidophilus]PPQ40365.1 acyl dehydratase [Rhodoblastus acidophilus]RAI22259.1 acyl dehydratase [Rhodoblastus acidophilus]SNB65883.1 3-hydroxybutyryl-CoA dehydratase [Rhodoblastus acidophilus]